MYRTTDPFTVCNTILQMAFDEKIDVTPMKLQKLLYLIYRNYLHMTNQALFPARFEAWSTGPVIAKVYDAFKQYKDKPITKMYARNDGNCYMANINGLNSTDPFHLALKSVWSNYKNYTGIELTKFIQELDMAWKKAWNQKDQFLSDFDIRNEYLWDIDTRRICRIGDKKSLDEQIEESKEKKTTDVRVKSGKEDFLL